MPIPIPTDDDRKQFIADSKSLEHPFDRWCYDTFLIRGQIYRNIGVHPSWGTRGLSVAEHRAWATLVMGGSPRFVDVEFNGNRDKLT